MPASITFTGLGNQLTAEFDILNIPTGFAIFARPELESLVSAGVDGTLYRNKGSQFSAFSMRAIRFHATFENATAFAQALENCGSQFINITSPEHGTQESILCTSISTEIRTGHGGGVTIDQNPTAYTISTLEMVKA